MDAKQPDGQTAATGMPVETQPLMQQQPMQQ